MGHRHLFRTSQTFENHEQNWNPIHVEQPYLHLGGPTSFENDIVLPMENVSNGGATSVPHWGLAPRATDYSSSSMRIDVPQYRSTTSGPIYDPFMHPSAAGGYCQVPQNFSDRPSSSSYPGHIHGVEGGVDNSCMANGRGPCKRKSPVTSVVCGRVGTSSYYDAGSSSAFSLSSDLHPVKPTVGAHNWPWDPKGATPNYRENNLLIAEASQRNVRSRSTLDLEMNLARTHLSNSSYPHLHSTGHPIIQSGALDLAGPSVGATTRDWNRPIMSSAVRGRILGPDMNGASPGTDHFLAGSSSTSSSLDFNGYNHGPIPTRNSAVPLQNLHGPAAHSARGGRSGYAQRGPPGYRAVSNYPRMGHMSSSENGLQLMADAYSSRPSSVGWRGSERNARSRISYDRLRSFPDNAADRDRMVSEGMMMDRSTFYGSRNLLDQHRDMRLDVDSMSYEELLALGERIGSVNTGLSEDLISKCLTETTYCFNQKQEEETCAICLEEYKNKDNIGTLKNCSHDYHAGCIRKWLLMKNVCPICKSPALADNSKDK